MHRHTHTHTHTQTDRHRQTHSHTHPDRQTDRHRQTDTHTHTHTHTQTDTHWCVVALLTLSASLRVVQTVDSDVVLQDGAADRAEDGQLQSLSGGGADRLTHQTVRAQRLRQDVTRFLIHLDIAGSGEVLLTHHHHVLHTQTHTHTLKII